MDAPSPPKRVCDVTRLSNARMLSRRHGREQSSTRTRTQTQPLGPAHSLHCSLSRVRALSVSPCAPKAKTAGQWRSFRSEA
jgi:hypothetical protein